MATQSSELDLGSFPKAPGKSQQIGRDVDGTKQSLTRGVIMKKEAMARGEIA